ncbi:MAG: DegT/DnrJ/EryC1/StrS family aminotransferase [Alphaproteobacteria bacterium]|nr:DegT/DnrJ/EryC1/StrS family aminotransferase [Alphaproteobacteria bacterium]MDP6589194.1 DegT/DnrJ/EryC1/StrS family aminotransferase [Alphaproteobacteria bacterium]MDP6816697.1 DegT/DnrJ/EryC1/StrS family aminotransferase [Alphaproteobacteria bacterium]
MSIPFIDLKAQYSRLKPEIDAGIERVLAHGRFILGPEVGEFEAALAANVGAAHVVSCANGTDALTLALMGENIGPGDAVFVPSFTFTATAETVLMVGATPVFVDVDGEDFLIDCGDLESKIAALKAAGGLTPRAVIPVDLFGLPADYDGLAKIAAAHDLFLLADAAQSMGGRYRGRAVGSLAPATVSSFFPAKPLGCYGDGGALLTDDAGRAEIWRSLRGHGKGKAKYDVVRVGMNSRLDTLQAAVLLAKLPGFAAEIEARERLAEYYDRHLPGAAVRPGRMAGSTSAWAQYTIQVEDRDGLAAALREDGIPTAIHYPLPMHLQTAYRGFGDGPGSLPVSEKLAAHVLSLPMHPDMDEATSRRICAAIERHL